ncbi:MAG TPA: ATP-binding protein, partial [Draconibacterium sp.]|nr:ATP-binding protein [Draconibacterium sp.]
PAIVEENVLRDATDRIIGIRTIIQDITERKKAEKEILILAHSLSSINECITITDLEDKIIFVNKSFLKTYGYPKNELIGKDINIVRSQNNPTKLVEKILPATLRGGWKGELLNKRKDGSEFPIYLSTTIINDTNGKPLGLIGVASDITEQKRIGNELIKAKERAEESDRLKSAFLANMSHEIRTPMNGILGFTQLLKKPKLSGEEQQEFIDIIEKSGARMLNIINDIIYISRIESGHVDISISETNINKQVEYIFNFFKPEANGKKLNLTFKNALPSDEAIIKTDSEKVYAVLSNLVKNALKFTNAGSIELGYEIKDKFLEFFVKDTGSGIPQEQKEFIFERFRQGSETLTRNYEGAGLGLAISKAYVELLGGKIWIESNKEQGSTFRFTIPYLNGIEKKEQLSAITEEENKPIRKLKILVVEDDKTSRILLNFMIKPLASDLFQAVKGHEAIELCRNNPDIDLVLMDIQMPDMDGYEATCQIREFNKEVVIIAQTAFALEGDREKAIEAGCNDYISKPIDNAMLMNLIKKYFEKQENGH